MKKNQNKLEYSSKGLKKVKDSNNKNKELDKFYTSPFVVDMLINHLVSLFAENDLDIAKYNFLEPCAGNGAFLNGLERNLSKNKYKAFDIEPEDESIKKADFLQIPHKYSSKRIIIGNPPFGYKAQLAKEFINKSAEWGPIIIFILPIQFRRFNIQKFVNPELKLIYSSENLPKNSFLLEGKPYHVNCLYQIWVNEKSGLFKNYPNLRLLKPLPNKHTDFQLFIHNNTVQTMKYFNKKEYGWNFAVARQGFYDYKKKIVDPTELKPHVQYLFVKYINPISKEIFKHMDFDKLSHVNTSILGYSNTDVVAEYERIKNELGYN
ncbi:hypothetical protein [Mycoplasmopsis iners]|uniref:hypothetical protein n=1 Tax=Mycoplasmopsis iners TaxID=76630 RepID=UPI00069000A9|nr:hypothetical protein [Mycoplasmopsis iners]